MKKKETAYQLEMKKKLSLFADDKISRDFYQENFLEQSEFSKFEGIK